MPAEPSEPDRGSQRLRLRVHLLHFLRGRPRLLFSLALGLAVPALLADGTPALTRVLVGWNIVVWVYVALVLRLMSTASAARVRALAEREDPGAAAVLVLLSLTATASLAAIVFELAVTRELPLAGRLGHYALTVVTLVGSWLFVNVLFTFHYARLYYRSGAAHPPLRFPDPEPLEPNYWDFLYFAITIAVAAQTSDVSVVSRGMRKVVLGQSVLGFVFNAAVIGMSINVAAGLVGA